MLEDIKAHSPRIKPGFFLHRRHLNESQRAVVAARLANMKNGGDRRSDQSLNLDSDNIPVKKAASMLNVSRDSVFTAKRVMREAPEKIKDIEAGLFSTQKQGSGSC